MNLKYVEFYQSVRLWNNQEYKTLSDNGVISLKLEDHLVYITSTEYKQVIIVPTANMRHGGIKEAQEEVSKIEKKGKSKK